LNSRSHHEEDKESESRSELEEENRKRHRDVEEDWKDLKEDELVGRSEARKR
jgi:hypothetical protein